MSDDPLFVDLAIFRKGKEDVSEEDFARTYKIIQQLKEERDANSETPEHLARKLAALHSGDLRDLVDLVRKALIQYKVDTLRPETNWADIAADLGLKRNTLRKYRERYDVDPP